MINSLRDLHSSTFKISLFFCLTFFAVSLAQNLKEKPFKINFYSEFYLVKDKHDFRHENANFVYNHKRINEPSLNLAFVKMAFNKTAFRANLALMMGDYANYNLSSEPNWAKNIFEANVGVKLFGNQNLWLDAGVMPSHLGFESAVGIDNLTLSRSILAENSPYYETGVKLSFLNEKENLSLAVLYLNAWQHIQKPSFITTPSFGLQVNYKVNPKLSLNYGNFIGSDKADSLKSTRIFHNIYGQYSPNNRWDMIFGFDIGTDKNSENIPSVWFSPVVIGRYSLNKNNKIAARIEYYHDPNQVIINSNTPNGFKSFGYSINYDYSINAYVSLRAEMKKYESKDRLFHQNTNASKNTELAILALIFKF